jgi:hypothetical protein
LKSEAPAYRQAGEIRAKHPVRDQFETSTNVQNTNVPNKQEVLNIELEILDLPALLSTWRRFLD